jgi:hypothetical protein
MGRWRRGQRQVKRQKVKSKIQEIELILCISRDMLAYIANTYGTSFIQTHPSIRRDIAGFATNIIRQSSKVFDKFMLLCKTKPIFQKSQVSISLIATRDYEKNNELDTW